MRGMIHFIVIPSCFVYMGIEAIVDKQWCFWSYSPYCFNFSGFSVVVGSFFIFFGIVWFLAEIRKKRRNKGKEPPEEKPQIPWLF